MRKAAESTAHVAGFGMYFGELRLSKPLTGGAGRMAPGCLRGRVWRDAFLVSFGHSKRLRARGAMRPALEAGGAGAPAAAEGRTGLWPCEPVGEASRVSCASRALETLARGLRALRAALAWLAPEARDRPRIRILKRAGRQRMSCGHGPLRPTATIFGVAPPLWVVRRHRRERNERRAQPAPTATIERPGPEALRGEIRIPGSFSKSSIWRRNPARARVRLPASSGRPASQTCAADSAALRSKASLRRPPPGEAEG